MTLTPADHRRRPRMNSRDEPPPLPPKDNAWMRDAACADGDYEVWFPKPGYTNRRNQAIATCERCPVRAECLEYAQTEPLEMHGIWAGLGPKERQRERAGRTA